MKRFSIILTAVAVAALLVVPVALATSHPVVPTVDVAAYAQPLLSSLGSSITAYLPWVAAITAFAITVGLMFRLIGRKSATRVGR